MYLSALNFGEKMHKSIEKTAGAMECVDIIVMNATNIFISYTRNPKTGQLDMLGRKLNISRGTYEYQVYNLRRNKFKKNVLIYLRKRCSSEKSL